MIEINKAFTAFLLDRIDVADLKIIVRKRINELKKCQRDCQFQKELKNLK